MTGTYIDGCILAEGFARTALDTFFSDDVGHMTFLFPPGSYDPTGENSDPQVPGLAR